MNTFASFCILSMYSNLLVKKNILINPFIYSRIKFCVFLKKSNLRVIVIYNLAFSQRSVYPYSWWNVLWVPLFQERTPSWRVRRWRVVTTTDDSHEMKQEVCYQNFAVEGIFQQFLRILIPEYAWSIDSMNCNGTYIAYVFMKEICLCAIWLAAICAVFELLSRQPNHLSKNEVSIKVKSFLKFLKSNSYSSDRGWVRMA